MLVRVIEREHNTAQKLAVVVAFGDLDAASGGLVGIGQRDNFSVPVQIDKLNAALREITGRDLAFLAVIRAEGQSRKNHNAGFIGRSLGDFAHVFIKDGKLCALQGLARFGIRFEYLDGACGFVVDDGLGDDLPVFRNTDGVLGIIQREAGNREGFLIEIVAQREIGEYQNAVAVRPAACDPVAVAVKQLEAGACNRGAAFVGLDNLQAALGRTALIGKGDLRCLPVG